MGRVLCILYHRVNPIKDNLYNLTVSPSEFEEHIRYLVKNYRIIRFEENWEEISEDAIAITFDDGYADNYLYALPVLEKYKVPATIFICSGNIGTCKEFWWDEIERVLTVQENYPEQFHLCDQLYEYTWKTATEYQRKELAKTLRWLLRMESDESCAKDWIEHLKIWAGIISDEGRTENLSLSKEQLTNLAKSPYITIGAHTVRHLSLGALSDEDQECEIVNSISYLEKELKQKIEVFSYPFGTGSDYNKKTLETCRRNGIKKAATTKIALWNKEDNLLEIPRLSIKNGNLQMLIKDVNRMMEK